MNEFNEHNKNNPDFKSRTITILNILEKNLADNVFTRKEEHELFSKLALFRSGLNYSELKIRIKIDDIIESYRTKYLAEDAIEIGDYE